MTPTILITLYFSINCLFTDVEDFKEEHYLYFFVSVLFWTPLFICAISYEFYKDKVKPEVMFYYRLLFEFNKHFGEFDGDKKKLIEHSEKLSGCDKKRFLRHLKMVDKKWQLLSGGERR